SDYAGAGTNANPRAVWEDTGSSYEYFPGAFMLLGEFMYLKDPAFGVTKAYEKDRHWPICLDYDDFHKVRRHGPMRNAVFFPDCQTGWMIDISNADTGKFIEDMRRYSGVGAPTTNRPG